jgi:hypothetical protein
MIPMDSTVPQIALEIVFAEFQKFIVILCAVRLCNRYLIVSSPGNYAHGSIVIYNFEGVTS